MNEFAKNLREGRVTLPLNDKSKELAAEVKKLKDQVRQTGAAAGVVVAVVVLVVVVLLLVL